VILSARLREVLSSDSSSSGSSNDAAAVARKCEEVKKREYKQPRLLYIGFMRSSGQSYDYIYEIKTKKY